MMASLMGSAPSAMFGLAPPQAADNALPMIWNSEGNVVLRAGAAAEPMEGGVTAGVREQARGWSPYEFNGGTALGIAGADYAVVAADTRLSEGYSILSRNVSKAKILTQKCVIGTGGCWTDVATLHKMLGLRIDTYRHDHDSDMSTTGIAQMLGNTLYYKRFFPYYAFNVVAGLDSEGKGAVFTYDAVGSFERVSYAAQGAGQKLIIPLLDNLVGRKNRMDPAAPPTVTEAVELCKEAFITAGERDIYTGDAVEIFIITKEGVRTERFALKKD